jgi:hypothetical protein
MPKKTNKSEKDSSKKINVEIAPGNRTRLDAFLKSYNEHPNRSRPMLTLTDVLNEALDEFFSGSPAIAQAEQQDKENRHEKPAGGKAKK